MTQADLALARDHDASPGVSSSAVASSTYTASKLALMDQAYTEYVRLQEETEGLDLDTFCARYPDCRSSLRRLLQAHQFLDGNPKYLDGRPDVPWPKVGERYGDLTLLRELGRGSFSRVYLATEASTGDRLVAVKFSQRGDAEARTQGRLSHPHIVPILSARQDESTGLMAVRMPYLGTATLEDVLDRAWPAPPSAPPGTQGKKAKRPRKTGIIPNVLRDCAQPEDPPVCAADPRLRTGSYADGVIHLAGQLAEALAFLHAQRVCHRDLKPSNVLLDPSGKPLLLDFNLSTSERETAMHTGGTLRYMAPEQIRAFLDGKPEGLDERADLFALAVMVYELLAGDHPYGAIPADLIGEPLARFLLQRHQDGFRPLRQLCPDLARPVARALDRCLAVDSADRPRSATELAGELKRQFSPARRMRRWIAGHPLAVVAALCLLLFGTAAARLAWSARELRSPVTAPSRAPSVTPLSSAQEYQRGLTAYRASDFDEAEICFDRAFQADPKNSRYRFARGVARFKQSKYLDDGSEKLEQAWNDIKLIVNNEPDDATKALTAYMRNREQKADRAIDLYTELLQGPYRRAMVLNNRGYSYLCRNRRDNPDDFTLAMNDLDEAARLDPTSQAVHFNRAKIVSIHWSKKIESRRHNQALEDIDRALDDIDRAVQSGPTCLQLYYDGARLYAKAAHKDLLCGAVTATTAPSLLGVPPVAILHWRGQQRVERCLSYVSQAITSGDPTDYRTELDFRFLRDQHVFPAPSQTQSQQPIPPIDLTLIDPVELPD
jgi:serine/threonine protein kinase/tetratricopeptide (TPR) repeat protein